MGNFYSTDNKVVNTQDKIKKENKDKQEKTFNFYKSRKDNKFTSLENTLGLSYQKK
jgi:hypothetical protein